MPELPEVETVRLALERLALGLEIAEYICHRPDYLTHGRQYTGKLAGSRIESAIRRGKFLVLLLDGDFALMHHLGMSGRMLVTTASAEIEPHTHVQIRFRGVDAEIRQRDPRRFGFAAVFTRDELSRFPSWAELGPDPFSLNSRAFAAILHNRQAPVKNLLLNQRRIAGLGNIYVDEGLFRAGIHPLRPAGDLSPAQSALLLKCLKRVLRESIAAGGSTTNDFRRLDGRFGEFQHKHRVYRREGEPCPSCGAIIEKIILGGRGTHFCPSCQSI
ncbi:MAG: bifunctional DNA-formamidopyrimidine glycosylase/DNA-(apurinic or apyrimidinic site) lyase [bacterium]|nr:bifunctional DNA-formamidopyrimidine glycosylase/DNA-(apurinic or apyrimidinic site) lyase [bacterium]